MIPTPPKAADPQFLPASADHDTNPVLLHGVLLFIQMGFGLFHVFGKGLIAHTSPWSIACFRVVFAIPVLTTMACLVDRKLPGLRDLPYLAMLGFFGVCANQLLFLHGLQYTSATETGILMTAIPVAAAIVAVILRIEAITPMKAAGIALAVCGAVVIVVNPFAIAWEGDHLYGNLFIMSNCFCYGTFLVLQKPILRRVPPLTVIAWSFVFGGLGILLVAGGELFTAPYAAFPPVAWLSLAYILLIPTCVNYALNTWTLKRAPSSLVATYTTLQPLFSCLGGTLFLGEEPGLKEAVGFALIVSGLVTVNRARKR